MFDDDDDEDVEQNLDIFGGRDDNYGGGLGSGG